MACPAEGKLKQVPAPWPHQDSGRGPQSAPWDRKTDPSTKKGPHRLTRGGRLPLSPQQCDKR
eukprot:12934048-Prorocentrum_lima.AAC.1